MIVVHDQTCDAICAKLKEDMATLAPILAKQDRAHDFSNRYFLGYDQRVKKSGEPCRRQKMRFKWDNWMLHCIRSLLLTLALSVISLIACKNFENFYFRISNTDIAESDCK